MSTQRALFITAQNDPHVLQLVNAQTVVRPSDGILLSHKEGQTATARQHGWVSNA